jgi:hypothetical protein
MDKLQLLICIARLQPRTIEQEGPVGAPLFHGHVNPYRQFALADLPAASPRPPRPKILMARGGVGSSLQARKDLVEIERSPLRQAVPSTFSPEMYHVSGA